MVYEDGAWQAFLEQIIRLVSRHGYQNFSLSMYPLTKFSKWGGIDKKLIAKYHADSTTMQRYRARKKGYCAYYFLRWKQYAILFKSTGQVPPGIIQDDIFLSISRHSINIRIGESVVIQIVQNDGRITAKLDEKTYKGLKSKLFYAANDAQKKRNAKPLEIEYNKLNGLPCWRGILQQKRRLKRYCTKLAKERRVTLNASNLRFRILRQPHKSKDFGTLPSSDINTEVGV
ncbi:hypothetical protein [Sporomusa sphaeroides]|uniref:Transposase n=1 Tax=Sporomusa sphaeroides DSM 2875 TaxID=1337886 RepID=A0ABM9W212_9FIRM|nr:hypothetical protein [Sporomusa sphaeroides]OLS56144.1 hypothetical protein SPSPH_25330 [Sporomusa sphaeroides DSM 2875]CVK19214.1 hypothetical protein SSPH_01863 [Sporomusa sphaeroides DSM 2875]